MSFNSTKPLSKLTLRHRVIPESHHQDTLGTLARTVRDAVYALDAIYGIDPLDNDTFAQAGRTPLGGYAQFLSNKDALKNATFGIPWQSFWALTPPEQQTQLIEIIDEIEAAGATIVNGTELKDYERIVSPDGWDYGSTRVYPNVRPGMAFCSPTTLGVRINGSHEGYRVWNSQHSSSPQEQVTSPSTLKSIAIVCLFALQ
jgi:Asp-tRNA(Asn)/Glu-tRNA(Gln) amidotransferase A subunit family amidase